MPDIRRKNRSQETDDRRSYKANAKYVCVYWGIEKRESENIFLLKKENENATRKNNTFILKIKTSRKDAGSESVSSRSNERSIVRCICNDRYL